MTTNVQRTILQTQKFTCGLCDGQVLAQKVLIGREEIIELLHKSPVCSGFVERESDGDFMRIATKKMQRTGKI